MDDLIMFLECDAIASSLGREIKSSPFGDIHLKGKIAVYEKDKFLHEFDSLSELHEFLTSLPQFKTV